MKSITISKKEIRLQEVLSMAHNDYERGMKTHAFFKVHDHEKGEDLVQDTFMKTWMYLVKGGEISTMKAFLYHILNHLIVDEYRKHKALSLDMLLEKGFEQGDGDHKRIFDIMDGKTAVILIRRLPRTYQKVMRLRYVQGLSINEIALITGQSKNTIAVQAHRGLEKLKMLYEHPS